MTRDEVEELIIGLLAQDAGLSPAELRMQLRLEGDELPVNSLLAVEVLARVEQTCGVSVEANEQTARAMRSVRAYTDVICQLIEAQQQGRASA